MATHRAERHAHGMFSAVASISIERSPEDVFDYLVEPANWPRWVCDVKSVEARGSLRQGDAFTEVTVLGGREKRSRGEVLSAEPGKLLVLRVVEVISGPGLLPTRRFDLARDEQGTRLTWTSNVEVRGAMHLFAPFLPSLFRKKKGQYLAALRRELVAGGAS